MPPSEPPQVLLVCDSVALKKMLRSYLEKYPDQPLHLIESPSYGGALTLYQPQSIDLVILTDSAQGPGALEWLEPLQSQHQWLPVLFIHNGSDPETPIEALRHGAQDAFAFGQLQSRTLHWAIRRILHTQKLRSDNRRMAQELQRSNQELSQFAHSISHDLREPLRKIQSFGELLQESCAPRLQEEELFYLERMMDGAKRLSHRIQALLTYGTAGMAHTHFQPVSIPSILQQVLDDLELVIQENGAHIQIDGEFPTLVADPTRLHQLFLNLVSNALKYRHPDRPPEIHIHSQKHESHDHIACSDNGIGFPSSEAERIFQLFTRLHTKSNDSNGYGIGLAVCRRIVESMGGQLVATATEGKGATFTMILPTAPHPTRSP